MTEGKNKPDIEKITISDLDASHIKKRIRIDCQKVGQQTKKTIPKGLVFECNRCGNTDEYYSWNDKEGKQKKAIIEHCLFKKKIQYPLICPGCETKKGKFQRGSFTLLEEGHSNLSILFVRDLLNVGSKFDESMYETFKIYLIGKRLPKSNKIIIEGEVVTDPQTRDLTIIAEDISPLESEIDNFKLSDGDKEDFVTYFVNSDVDLKDQISPDMVGRPLVKEALLLLLHTPPIIPDIARKDIRGCLRVMFYGDTDTYKSLSAKDLTNDHQDGHFGFGEYISIETGKRTGILYTIDAENKALIWGSLPLNDLGLVVLDGLQAMSSEELGEFREALTSQIIKVRRMVSGEALARVRLIGCFNPNKPMEEFLHPCMGIKSSSFYKQPDVTRWDIWLPFGDGDVDSSLIANRMPIKRPLNDEIFKRHVLWVWSRRPEQILYTKQSEELIKKVTMGMIERFGLPTLPLVSNAFRDNLCRISVAYACLSHSVDSSHEKVLVDKKHVIKAIVFFKEVFGLLELYEYKLEEEGRRKIMASDFEKIIKELDETDYEIIEAIKGQSLSSQDLAERLDVSDRTIREHYKHLKKFDLIKTSGKSGASLTVTGIKFVKLLAGGTYEVVKKSFTTSQKLIDENASCEGKLHNFTTLSDTGEVHEEVIEGLEKGQKSTLKPLVDQASRLKALRNFIQGTQELSRNTRKGEILKFYAEEKLGPKSCAIQDINTLKKDAKIYEPGGQEGTYVLA